LAELLVERTAPELLYLEAKFASLVSYGLSMKLLEEALPIGAGINASTIRNHTLAVAERLESELGYEQAFFIEGCERDWEELPGPEMPLTVGIDGGYVNSCERKGKKDGRFEVIVGKSMTAEGESKCFGLVNSYDTKPKRRVFEALKSQGDADEPANHFPLRRGRHGSRTATLFESPGRTSARLVSREYASDGDESNGERPRPRRIRVAGERLETVGERQVAPVAWERV